MSSEHRGRATPRGPGSAERTRAARAGGGSPPAVPWPTDAVLYELSVRAFQDGNADGVGDFAGLRSRLDYLRDLGVDTLVLQPFFPSPLRDGGYDVADHLQVHPDHGTLSDFLLFVDEAHARGLRVVVDLVLNHTSDRHPWFERARRAPAGSAERDYYVWSPTALRFPEARVLYPAAEASNWAWDEVARAYYWHRFHAHEPDLNYDREAVRAEMLGVATTWLERGADGLRLVAAPFLHEREGTPCEDLPETHAFLRELRAAVQGRFPRAVLLTEANLWPEEAVHYFGSGDECQVVFQAPLAARLFTALHMEDRFPVVDLMEQTPEPPAGARWGLFLRSHDELSLEMVTDEERDTMLRAYATQPRARLNQGIRRRLAPMLGNDRRRLELLNGLLLSLPGTPALYYGDEIGMGDNVFLPGRLGVRTPMQWGPGLNAGFSEANPQQLYAPPVADPEYAHVSVNVATQAGNPRSLLSWMRALVATRRRLRPLSRGSIRFLEPENRRVLAFVREDGGERVLVVANLGRHVQHVELDLSAHRGRRPVEVSGRTELPVIGEAPLSLTLAGHAFYWFSLEEPVPAPGPAPGAHGEAGAALPSSLPHLEVRGPWHGLLHGRATAALAGVLPAFLASRRWFAGKAREVREVDVVDAVPLGGSTREADPGWIALIDVAYASGEPETYALALAFAAGERAGVVRREAPHALVAELDTWAGPGLLYAAEGDPAFTRALLEVIAAGRSLPGGAGVAVGEPSPAGHERLQALDPSVEPRLLSAEQSNSSIRYGDALVLKLFRKLDTGVNPDLEVGRFLTGSARFPHTPPVCGALSWRPARGEPLTLAILQGFVRNEGDAWAYTLDAATEFFERLAEGGSLGDPPPPDRRSLLQAAGDPVPEEAPAAVGPYLEAAALLGRRTAELHRALASDTTDPAFAPEPFTRLDQRALYQSLRNLTDASFELLRVRLPTVAPAHRPEAERVLALRPAVLARLRRLVEVKLEALRTRTHGDYHLGQVLWTGRDFVIIDFEGEPARPAAIRRAKRTPLRDVAGLLRSYHYAAHSGRERFAATGGVRDEAGGTATLWAEAWNRWVCAACLRAYLEQAQGAAFLPRDPRVLEDLLVVSLLEKAVYELAYELNNRPAWVSLPLRGIASLLEEPQ